MFKSGTDSIAASAGTAIGIGKTCTVLLDTDTNGTDATVATATLAIFRTGRITGTAGANVIDAGISHTIFLLVASIADCKECTRPRDTGSCATIHIFVTIAIFGDALTHVARTIIATALSIVCAAFKEVWFAGANIIEAVLSQAVGILVTAFANIIQNTLPTTTLSHTAVTIFIAASPSVNALAYIVHTAVAAALTIVCTVDKKVRLAGTDIIETVLGTAVGVFIAGFANFLEDAQPATAVTGTAVDFVEATLQGSWFSARHESVFHELCQHTPSLSPGEMSTVTETVGLDIVHNIENRVRSWIDTLVKERNMGDA